MTTGIDIALELIKGKKNIGPNEAQHCLVTITHLKVHAVRKFIYTPQTNKKGGKSPLHISHTSCIILF